MREPIAKIALAPGQVGYYDQYSRIHLTLGKPEAIIYSGTNCAQIRRSIKAGTIRLVSGTLGEQIPPLKLVKTTKGIKLVSNAAKEHEPVFITPKIEPVENKPQPVPESAKEDAEKIDSAPVTTPTEKVEEKEAEPVKEVQTETQKKKTTRRKKNTEATESTESTEK